jgi:hypothetical protein
VRRLAAQPKYQEACQFFTQLSDRGPPLLTASLTMAARQAPFWRRVIETKAVSGRDAIELKKACDVVDRAATYAVSDGLFAAFVSQERQLTPQEVLGVRRHESAFA